MNHKSSAETPSFLVDLKPLLLSLPYVRPLASAGVMLSSYFSSLLTLSDARFVAKHRKLTLISKTRHLVSPQVHNYNAFLLASGPSINHLLDDTNPKSQLTSLYSSSYKVVLNTTIFSSLSYHLALVELPSSRVGRTYVSQLFSTQNHLRGWIESKSNLCFTNAGVDQVDDYLSNLTAPKVSVLPSLSLNIPHKKTPFQTILLSLLLRIHVIFARLGLITPALSVRSSAVRAVLTLVACGFRNIYILGLDGGTTYYYHDEEAWPHLQLLRDMHSLSNSLPYINTIRNGRIHRKILKPISVTKYHPTDDPSTSEYTTSFILALIADTFKVNIINLSDT